MYDFDQNITINPVVARNSAYSTQQNIQMVESICEGPIRGLQYGAASVFFNNVRAKEISDSYFYDSQNTIGSWNAIGNITFTGSSNVGTVSNTIPVDYRGTFNDKNSRFLQLPGTAEFSATVSNVQIDSNGYLTKWTSTLSNAAFDGTFGSNYLNGTNFTPELGQLVVLKQEGNTITGFLLDNADGTALFTFYGAQELINSSASLTVSYFMVFSISEITGTTVTVDNPSNVTAGTYNYTISGSSQVDPPASGDTPSDTDDDPAKTKGFDVQLRTGSIVQNEIESWNGVGGGVSIPSDQAITTPTLKQLQQTVATANSITLKATDRYLDGGSNAADGNSAVTIISPNNWTSSNTIRKEAKEIRFEIKYGRMQAVNSKTGDNLANTAIYAMDIRFKTVVGGSWGSWQSIYGQVTHTANFSAPLSWQHYVNLEGYRKNNNFVDFEIRIARLSRHVGAAVTNLGGNYSEGDPDKYKQGDSISQVLNVTAELKDTFYYPFTAHAGISFNSTQFSSVPRTSYELQGKLVKIPSAYTPREYNGGVANYDPFWDGTFKEELFYTDNPAWVFYDMLTNKRYGLGEYLTESDIDKYALYRISRYCDELVDDGNGGTEPRYRANIFFTKASDAYKVLKDMATTFGSILYWMDGKISPILDAPGDPVYNFTKGNVIDGNFTYQSTGDKTKANQVVVTWNDPELNYAPSPLVLEDRDAILKDGKLQSVNAVAFGATSEGQALRYGRWKLWTAQNQTEIVTFSTALAGSYLRPGDIINVQDADRYGSILSGRVKSATSNTITIDRSIDLGDAFYDLNVLVTESAAFLNSNSVTIVDDLSASLNYNRGDKIKEAWVKESGVWSYVELNTSERASNAFTETGDGVGDPLSLNWKPYTHVQEYRVSEANQTGVTVLTLTSGTFEVTPTSSSVWALKETTENLTTLGSAKQYRILSVGQQEENTYQISAAEHYNEKYTAVEIDYALGYVPDEIYLPEPRIIPPVKSVAVSRQSRGIGAPDSLRVAWQAPDDFYDIAGYQIFHTIEDVPSPITVDSQRKFYDFDGISEGYRVFVVRVLSSRNNLSKGKYCRYDLRDTYNGESPRIGYIVRGASATSPLIVNQSVSDTGIVRFENNAVAIAPSQNPGDSEDNDPTNALTYSQDCKVLEGSRYLTTSSTSNGVSTGSKTFTVGSGLPYVTDKPVFIKRTADGNTNLTGTVTSYTGTTLVVDITSVNGTGTYTD